MMFNLLRRSCSIVRSISQQQQLQQQQQQQQLGQRQQQAQRWCSGRESRIWYEKPRTQKPVHVCIPENMPKFIAGFNDIPELENASEVVQKIFSLEMGSHHNFRATVSETNKKIYGSKLEQRIADRTHLIRDMTEQLRVGKKDTVKKQYFISLIQKRKKLLRKLQERDSAAYHAIIKKMEIPPLQSYWESHHRHTSRKSKRNVPIFKKRHIDDFEEEFVV